jgi:AraC-like DNA-binding protein
MVRQPLPATLLVWALPEPVVAVLRQAAGREARVVTVHDGSTVPALLRAVASLCLVVPVLRDRFDPFWTEYTLVRERFPNIPVVAVALPGVSSMQAVIRLSQLGVSDLLDANDGLRPDDVRGALSKAYSDATAQRVWQAVAEEFERNGKCCPEDLVTMLRRALRHAHQHLPASKLAALMQMHERTLRKYCEGRSLPSPQIITGWARLLLAALYLDDPGRSVSSVSELLGYPTPGALRKQILRYTGRSPRQLRVQGALSVATQLLQQSVLPQEGPAPAGDERPRLVLLRNEDVA